MTVVLGVVRFEFHMAETVRAAVVWGVTPRSLVEVYQLFREALLHFYQVTWCHISEDASIHLWHPLDSIACHQLTNSVKQKPSAEAYTLSWP